MESARFMPLSILTPKEAWFDLGEASRKQWLENQIGRLRDFQIDPSGAVWISIPTERLGKKVVLLWNLASAAAQEGLRLTLCGPVVREYFDVEFLLGASYKDDETFIEFFLESCRGQ
jgi:hypothetical protein